MMSSYEKIVTTTEESVNRTAGCDVQLQNFGISLKLAKTSATGKTEKTIIHPLSVRIRAGKLFAILGGSGSGKTTLLNVLAERYDERHFHIHGHVNFTQPECHVGYVTQSDFLLPFLTVYETLLFTAKLKVVQASHDTETLEKVIEQVILDLGLKECAHNRIGDDDNAVGHRGISGGERRRVSVGVQILTNPQVLCADEPTSGLDSFTAITVIECLKRLSIQRHTNVICSIHQPRADIFHMFDDVLLLTKGGYAIYCGSTSSMVQYFSNIGYLCPENANPADFFIDLSSVNIYVDSKDQKLECLQRLRHLVDAFNENATRSCGESSASNVPKTPFPSISTTKRVSWFQQVSILFYRFLLNTLRDRSSLFGGVVQATVLGLVLMGIFFDLDESFAAIRSRTGLLYICVSLEAYIMMLILVHKYCIEVKILDRELQDELYHPTAYFVAHFLSSVLPMLFLPMIIFCIPAYFGTGLRLSADSGNNDSQTGNYFGTFLAVMLTIALCINGVSWTSISLSRLFPIASLISNMSFTFLSLSCGFLVNLEEMPVYIRWLKNITFLSYGYRILMENEFQDRLFEDCSDASVGCVILPGNDILPTYGVKLDNHKTSWPVLFAIAIAYHILPMLFLTYLRFPPTSSAANGGAEESTTDIGDEDDEEDELLQLQALEKGSAEFIVKSQVESSSLAADDLGDVQLTSIGYDDSKPDLSSPQSTTEDVSVMSPRKQISQEGVFRQVSSQSSNTFDGINSKALLWDITVRHIDLFAAIPSPSASVSTSPTTSNKKQLLYNINVHIPAGKLVAVLGGSGSGKSTLLNLVANRIPHTVLQRERSSTENQSKQQQPHLGNGGGRSSVYSGFGEILYKNQRPSAALVRSLVGYVQQNDYHLPSLTVRETLLFHAKLRLDETQPDFKETVVNAREAFHNERVRQVLQMLGLTRCRHVCVGNAEKKGISGGEKRRLSVGVQLLSDPSICLLDEPTTGLDAFTARHVVMTLKRLATGQTGQNDEDEDLQLSPVSVTPMGNTHMQRPRTVVFSIHQPRYDVFALFDEVVLMSRGHVMWTGDTVSMLQHFAHLDFVCPSLTNPADFILDISSIDMRTVDDEQRTRNRWQLLVAAFVSRISDAVSMESSSIPTSLPTEPNTPTKQLQLSTTNEIDIADVSIMQSPPDHTMPSNEKTLFTAFPLVLHRAWLNLFRQPELLTVRLTQTLFYALILCIYYAPAKNTQQSIQNRVGNLYEFTALTFVGMLNCIAIFPTERNVFYREYFDGFYSSWCFIAVYFSLAAPLSAIASAVFSVLMACAVGLQPTFLAFLQFTYITWTFLMTGEALGVLFCTLFDEIGFSVNVVSVVISFFGVMAGFISPTMDQGLIYFSYLSPMRWGAFLLMHISFENESFRCDKSAVSGGGGSVPCLSTGEEVLQLYNFGSQENFKQGRYGESFHYYMSAIVMLIFVIIAVASTRIRAWRLSH